MPLEGGTEPQDEEYSPYAEPADARPVTRQSAPPEPDDADAFQSEEDTEESVDPETDGYAPFDLQSIRDTEPVSTEKVLRDESGNRLPSFDNRIEQDFEGLMFLGALTKTFDWLGHSFLIRTLTMDEELALSVVTKPYADTPGSGIAYQTAVAALCTYKVDGKMLPVPYQESDGDGYEWARQRFNYVKAKWFRPTLSKIYTEYLELEERSQKVVDVMGKASSPGAPTTG